ncbi:MAG: hypothetical protein JXR37_19830 [Kiritimatiellae bacterium]|nr:hypothetical protein [Kiritimatiellia bacterium]
MRTSLLLLTACLLAPALDAEEQAPAPYRHAATGLVFPLELGGLSQSGVVEYEKEQPGLGISVGYHGAVLTATLYLYTMGEKRIADGVGSDPVKTHFSHVVQDVFRAQERGYYEDVIKLFEGNTALGSAADGPDLLCASLMLKLRNQDRLSRVCLMGYKNHFFKIRFTYLAAAKERAEAELEAFMNALAHLLAAPPPAPPDAPGLAPAICVDADSVGAATSPAWLAYLVARTRYVLEHKSDYPAVPGPVDPLYDEEVAGRSTLAEVWTSLKREDETLQDPYLDALAKVAEAGFVREYARVFLARPHWPPPEESLRLEAFDAWRKAHLPDHRPQTHGYVEMQRREEKAGVETSN